MRILPMLTHCQYRYLPRKNLKKTGKYKVKKRKKTGKYEVKNRKKSMKKLEKEVKTWWSLLCKLVIEVLIVEQGKFVCRKRDAVFETTERSRVGVKRRSGSKSKRKVKLGKSLTTIKMLTTIYYF